MVSTTKWFSKIIKHIAWEKNRKKQLLKDSYRENKLTVTREEEGEGLNEEFGVNRHVLLYIYI